MGRNKKEPRTSFVGFNCRASTHERVSALARATGLSRSEFLRRAVVVAERNMEAIRAMGEPDDPRSTWHH